jgi:hypothetical protein
MRGSTDDGRAFAAIAFCDGMTTDAPIAATAQYLRML